MVKNTVFLSSVSSEFEDLRKKILHTILVGGYFPISMEYFTSSADEITSKLKQYISDCDYFVILLGKKSGSIDSLTRKSYTEIEYDIAIDLGLKPIVFCKSVNDQEESVKNFIDKIKISQKCLWHTWNDDAEIPAAVVLALKDAEKSDPRPGWRRGIQIEVCQSPSEYMKFVLKAEKESKEIRNLHKRINTSYKPEKMIREIAMQRYGNGVDPTTYRMYIDGHLQRAEGFYSFLNNGNCYYELYNKQTLIKYAKGMNHNGINNLDMHYMIEILEKWKETIRKYSDNYFVGLVDDILPFKYELFDKRIVSMHETIGKHAQGRVSAFIIHQESIVHRLYNDFNKIWDHLDPNSCSPDVLCDWIDSNLIQSVKSIIKPKHLNLSSKISMLGLENGRDIGGISRENGSLISFGKFYRSDVPLEIDDVDKQQLIDMGIVACLDVRSSKTASTVPSALSKLPNISYTNICFDEEYSSELYDIMSNKEFNRNDWIEIFQNILEKQRTWIKDVFKVFSSTNGGVLYHCSMGKDRTGLLTILLLLLAEAKEEEIVIDYMKSYVYCEKICDTKLERKFPDEYYIADPKIAHSVISYIKTKYNNIQNYLFTCGLSNNEIQSIINKFE
jgi:protein-tyrosine phosphatase